MTMGPGARTSRASIEAVIARVGGTYKVRWAVETKSPAPPGVKDYSFAAKMLQGGDFSTENILSKRPMLVTFWASWCTPCLVEAPHIEALRVRYEKAGLAVVSVSIDVPADHDKLRAQVASLGLGYPVVLDSEGAIFDAYRTAQTIPLTLVFDHAGNVVFQLKNFKKGQERLLEGAVKGVMKRYSVARSPAP